VVALYYATTENLPFDFTIKLCYTIIREGGEEPPQYINRRASWKLDHRSWKFYRSWISWELELPASQASWKMSSVWQAGNFD